MRTLSTDCQSHFRRFVGRILIGVICVNLWTTSEAQPPPTNYPPLKYNPATGGFVPSTTNGHTIGGGGGGGSGLSGGTAGHVITASGATTIQDSGTALTSLVPTSRTVNGHALSSNVTVTDSDLGATTIGDSIFKLTNPSAITFLQINADNTATALSASAFRTAIGLGTLATQSGTFSGTSSGTNTGDQTITLTGPITGSGTGSFATTIADPELAAIAGLTSTANKFPYFTGSGTAALADLSSAMRTFLTTSSSANLRSLLTDENGTGAALFNGAANPQFLNVLNIGNQIDNATFSIDLANGNNDDNAITFYSFNGTGDPSFKVDGHGTLTLSDDDYGTHSVFVDLANVTGQRTLHWPNASGNLAVQNTYSAEQYGAIGDDLTNDTVALQAAMDAVPARGTLLLQAGKTFKITSALTRTNAQGPINIVSLGGQYGGATIHQATTNTTALSITVLESDVSLNEYDKASLIRGVRFNGPTGNTSGDAIYATAAIHLEYVSTYNFYNGLRLVGSTTAPVTGPYYSHIKNSMFIRAVNAGVYSATDPNHNLSFSTVRFDSCAYGAYIYSTTSDTERISFSGACTIERNTVAGLYLDGVRTVYIGQSYFESPTNNAPDIKLGSSKTCTDVTIESNWFTAYPGTSLWHIDSDRVTGLTLIGNNLPGSGAGGGDIRVTTNTTGIGLMNQAYVTSSGLSTSNARFLIQSNGDSLGNQVGIGFANSYGGTVKTWNIAVDNDLGKGLNFSEIGVANRLFIKPGGNVGVNTTNPTQNFQVGNGTDVANTTIDVNARSNSIAEYSWSKGGTQIWHAYIPPNSSDLSFYDSADRLTLSATAVTAVSGVAFTGSGSGLTGVPISTGISGLGTGVAASLAIANNSAGGYSPINGTATLSNKSISLGSNTITGTTTQFNTALSGDDFAFVGTANTFTAAQTNSTTGTASTPAMLYSGSWLTGGTGTTNFPHLLLQATGTTASTSWSTSGTGLGLNAVTGFAGNLVDLKVAGSTKWRVDSTGATYIGAGLQFTGNNRIDFRNIGGVDIGAGGWVGWANSTDGAGTLDLKLYRNTTSVAELNNGSAGQWASLLLGVRDSGTTTVTNGLTIGHQSTGTPAAGLGAAVHFNLNDTTTADVNAGDLQVLWTTATHAAPVSDFVVKLDNGSTTPAEAFRVVGSGGISWNSGATLKKVLSATATLDFGSTAAGASTDLTITVTGAALGDVVSIGVPDGSTVANSSYSAWVSATDTVKVRFIDNALVGTADPASGTFRAQVNQF
jgi:hypothetical protein